MNEGRNFFVWLMFMVAIFVTLAVLETLLEMDIVGAFAGIFG